jgi:hypothetical protein
VANLIIESGSATLNHIEMIQPLPLGIGVVRLPIRLIFQKENFSFEGIM